MVTYFKFYYDYYVENDITGDILIELTLPYLKELNVHSFVDRIKLDKLIQHLRVSMSSALNHSPSTKSQSTQHPSNALNLTSSTLPKFMATLDVKAKMNKNEKDSIMSMDFVKQNCIKVTGEKNETHVIHIQGCTTYEQIMLKILSKFNLPESSMENLCLFMHDAEGQTRALTTDELVEICSDPTRWERDQLVLRKKHTPFKFLNPEETQLQKKKDEKLNKFFGARPPSELISSNLLQFFPKDHKVVKELDRRSSLLRTSIVSMESLVNAFQNKKSKLETEVSNENDEDQGPTEEGEKKEDNEEEEEEEEDKNIHFQELSNDLNERKTAFTSKDELLPPIMTSFTSEKTHHLENQETKNLLQTHSEFQVTSTHTHFLDMGPKEWVKGSLIGRGSFGAVYLGLNSWTGVLMAVKEVDLSYNQMSLDSLNQEIQFLSDLQHPHIVRYLGAHHEASIFHIFLEYIPGGSIQANLETWGPFSEPMMKSYLKQVLLGVVYLHDQNIIHRDIKAANILVDHHGIVKISDFGISQKTQEALEVMDTSLQGSVYWMAPEVVKKMLYSRKSDIWSLGCLFLEMVTATHPWPNATQIEAIFKVCT
ncbi:ATP binding, partial [Coelomomyces lativittatus]